MCVCVCVCGGEDPLSLKAGSETERSTELRARGTEEGTQTHFYWLLKHTHTHTQDTHRTRSLLYTLTQLLITNTLHWTLDWPLEETHLRTLFPIMLQRSHSDLQGVSTQQGVSTGWTTQDRASWSSTPKRGSGRHCLCPPRGAPLWAWLLLGALVVPGAWSFLSEEQEELLVELHNHYRGLVSPSAAAMMPLVRHLQPACPVISRRCIMVFLSFNVISDWN